MDSVFPKDEVLLLKSLGKKKKKSHTSLAQLLKIVSYEYLIFPFFSPDMHCDKNE